MSSDEAAGPGSDSGGPPVHALVTGATGYVGSRLVAALADSGITVTASARDAAKFDRFDFPEQVHRVELDVADHGSCVDAFAAAHERAGIAVTVAYFLVHSIGEGDFAEQDLDSARQFASAARAAGVHRIVYLGGLVPANEELSAHLDSRADVGDALGDAGVELVWLRAAVILGAGSTSFELIRHIADRVPVIPIPTWMNHRVSPIAVDDVLRYLVAAAVAERLPAGSYDISNDDRPTYAELIRAYADDKGLRRWWLPFPPVPPTLVARIASWLTPLPRHLTADLIMSLPNSMDSNDHRIRDLVADAPLTTVTEALRRCRAPHDVVGVFAARDPLQLVDTDPDWAG
ncbi:NAD(P)H-binding protein [uncultured Jatrophihabitans sp.]|uniref:NAD(P)H-binding protein n=1 Tax=uncultured Jatrophihabitans sp. TaxID=1610747 RepID=UPI0035CB303F